LQGVAFVDAGQLWGATASVDLSEIEISPGTGIRFLSPIGPVRVDLGYRFRGGEHLSVVTSQVRPFVVTEDEPGDQIQVGGQSIPFVISNELAVLGPLVLFEESSSLSWRRFQLHVSIGQAF
jgi:outer membrane protein assembly factor BamA